MYILDTNVASELRKASGAQTNRAKIDPNVEKWIKSVSATSLYLSVITILELEIGCLRLERRDPAQGRLLRSWIQNKILPAFAGRILAIDTSVALRCAALHVPDHRSERDALIAATALVHGMTVVTRNTNDFTPTGVALLNPWSW
jgi:toxin FitB